MNKKWLTLATLFIATTAYAGWGAGFFGFFKRQTSASDTTTLTASDAFGRRITAVETTPTFSSTFNYTMPKNAKHHFVLKVNTDTSPITLNCSGSAVTGGDVTCAFYKMRAVYPSTTDLMLRASEAASPQSGTDAYYDQIGLIPSGANNFIPEATSTDEYILLQVTTALGATPAADASFTINAGSASINPTFEILNYTAPTWPTMPLMVELNASDSDDGHYGGQATSANQNAILRNYTDTMAAFRVYGYLNAVDYLDDDGGSPEELDIDEWSGFWGDGSYRTNVLDLWQSAGIPLFWWMGKPIGSSPTDSGDAAFATAAGQTITTESITSGQSVVFIRDEPTAGVISTVKTHFDNWTGNGTLLLLTTDLDYDDNDDPGGFEFGDYSDALLCPVIDRLEVSGGIYTNLASYPANRTCFYSSCSLNCGSGAEANRFNEDGYAGSPHNYVDFARIDFPSTRARAAFWLTEDTTWRDKIKFVLHYNSTYASIIYNGAQITTVADVSDSLDGKYFILDGNQGSRCFWYDVDDSGTTVPAGCSSADNSTEITTIVTNDTAATVASATQAVVDAATEFTAYVSSNVITVVGDVYDATQNMGDSGFSLVYDADYNEWKSPRSFNVYGDGHLCYANHSSFKPWVGLSAFAKENNDCTPSHRMAVINDSSYERDYLNAYYAANTVVPHDSMITDSNDYESDWGEYEYMRWRVLKALAAGNTIASHTLSGTKLRFLQQPTTTTTATNISPAVTVEILNRFGAVDTSDSSSSCTMTKASGSGTLSVTSPVTASSGVCTFSDVQFDTADDYTVTVAVSGMTSATSNSVTITNTLTDLNTVGTLAYWWNAQNVTASTDITSWDQLDSGETETLANAGSMNDPLLSAAVLNSLDVATFDDANNEVHQSILSPTLTTSYFLVVWKVDDTSQNNCVLSSYDRFNDYSLRSTTSKMVSLDVGNNATSWTDGTTAVDTNWHHAIVVVSSGANAVWLDGASSAEISSVGGTALPESIRIGGCLDADVGGDGGGGNPDVPFSGQIAEIAVWSALDMSGNGTGDEYETVNTYICDKYGSTMTGCP